MGFLGKKSKKSKWSIFGKKKKVKTKEDIEYERFLHLLDTGGAAKRQKNINVLKDKKSKIDMGTITADAARDAKLTESGLKMSGRLKKNITKLENEIKEFKTLQKKYEKRLMNE